MTVTLQAHLKVMTKEAFIQYKRLYHTVPHCIAISCYKPLIVGEKYLRTSNKGKAKYLCEDCFKKEIIIYFLEHRNKQKRVHGIEKFKSESAMFL